MSSGGTGRRGVRLLAIPAVILACLSGATFALAKLHLAKPGTPKVAPGSAKVVLGDQYRGQTIFDQTCAGCHGQGGSGGVGPKLAGAPYSLATVKAQIDHGGGSMPAHLVSGQKERDVLAYVATLVAPSAG